MTSADSAELNCLSLLYATGAWLVVLGLILEGSEIASRRIAKRKAKRFIGPVQHPGEEPKTPNWARNCGDIGFVILVGALVLEQVCHQRMEEITGREGRRLSDELASATILAGDATRQAADSNVKVEQLRNVNLKLEKELLEMREQLSPRLIDQLPTISGISPFPGTKALIIRAMCNDCQDVSSQIAGILVSAKWDVVDIVPTYKSVFGGIEVGVCSTNKQDRRVGGGEKRRECLALIDALISGGVEAQEDLNMNLRARFAFEGIVIVVGPRLVGNDAALAKALRKMLKLRDRQSKLDFSDPNRDRLQKEYSAAFNEYFDLQEKERDELIRRSSGTNSGPHIFIQGGINQTLP